MTCLVILLKVLAGIVAVILLAAWIFGRMFRVERRPDATHFVRTEDGWTLALHRYDPPAGAPKRLPVIGCHGLTGNHRGFDLIERTSLARTLAAAGHPTFLLDLRGAGDSDLGGRGGHPYYWRLSDHYRYDAPAAVQHVLELTGAKKLHWIGHSMGGMIAYAFLQGPLAAKIARCVILASPSVFTQMRPLHRFAPVLKLARAVPIQTLARAAAPLFEHSRLLQRIGGAAYLAPGVATVFAANGQGQCPTSLLADFARFIAHGHIVDDQGHDLVAGMSQVKTPTLFLVGEHDATAMVDSVRTAYEAFGSAEKKFIPLGKKHGHQNDYGHMGPLIGRTAAEEVFPEILNWLARDY